MAIRLKNTRKIIIDNQAFRWKISSNELGYLNLIVQKQNNITNLLVFKFKSDTNIFWNVFPYLNKDNYDNFNFKTIYPKDVSEMIQFSLQNGWNPDIKNKPFKLVEKKDFKV